MKHWLCKPHKFISHAMMKQFQKQGLRVGNLAADIDDENEFPVTQRRVQTQGSKAGRTVDDRLEVLARQDHVAVELSNLSRQVIDRAGRAQEAPVTRDLPRNVMMPITEMLINPRSWIENATFTQLICNREKKILKCGRPRLVEAGMDEQSSGALAIRS